MLILSNLHSGKGVGRGKYMGVGGCQVIENAMQNHLIIRHKEAPIIFVYYVHINLHTHTELLKYGSIDI